MSKMFQGFNSQRAMPLLCRNLMLFATWNDVDGKLIIYILFPAKVLSTEACRVEAPITYHLRVSTPNLEKYKAVQIFLM